MRKQVMVGAWFLIAVLTFCGARPLVALPTYTDIPLDGKVAEIVERGTGSLRKLHEKYGLVYAYE